MKSPREVWVLPAQRLGHRVLVFDQLDSTNSYAAALAQDPANDGIAILAEEQTTGRGQQGRVWSAPRNASVLLSVLLFPPPELRRPAILTAWAAVAVCDLVRELSGITPRIKWPNDVLINGRKVCGILIEQGQGVVVGIGLNIRQAEADFLAVGLPHATSLLIASGQSLAPPAVARRLLMQLDTSYHLLCTGDRVRLEASWCDYLGLLHQLVRVETADGWCEGKLVELGLDGVVIQRREGDQVLLIPERVQHMLGPKGSGLFA